MKKGLFAAIPAVILAVLGLACSETGGLNLDLDTRCDHILTPTLTGSVQNRTERDCAKALTLPVSINVTPLGGGVGGGALADFNLEKYIVTYTNVTGSGSASTAPASILDTVNVIVPGGSGSVGLAEVVILREAAKTAFPLDSDGFYGADPVGGVELRATVTFWGYPVGQPGRECSGSFTHQFTVYDVPDGSAREMELCSEEGG